MNFSLRLFSMIFVTCIGVSIVFGVLYVYKPTRACCDEAKAHCSSKANQFPHEYAESPRISPSEDFITLYNWPQSPPISVPISEVINDIYECKYIFEIDKVTDIFRVRQNFVTRERIFHVSHTIKGTASAPFYISCTFGDIENCENNEVKIALMNKKIEDIRSEYPIKKSYLLMGKDDEIRLDDFNICDKTYYVSWSDVYYYQFFIFGKDVDRLMDLYKKYQNYIPIHCR